MPSEFTTLIVTIIAFVAFWLRHLYTRDAGVIDLYWGPGFLVITLIYLISYDALNNAQLIFAAMVAVWSIRLGVHLTLRHQRAHKEDRRYNEMRRKGGASFWWTSLFKIFLLQAVIMWIIATPIHMSFHQQSASSTQIIWPLFSFGAILFSLGFIIEALADFQLMRFKTDPDNADKTLKSGLWAWSRHPNYFGEAVLWLGLGCCAYTISGELFAFIGPVILLFFLLKVSGVTMLEKHLSSEKKGYKQYIATTPAFIPRPPR